MAQSFGKNPQFNERGSKPEEPRGEEFWGKKFPKKKQSFGKKKGPPLPKPPKLFLRGTPENPWGKKKKEGVFSFPPRFFSSVKEGAPFVEKPPPPGRVGFFFFIR
eukprot:FR742198.1.p3 GENE.FR742198.1~~FR742198.1.p3  ORF type:complete len:105 (+),score=65.34 FR742198.1:882-1196(+)